MIKKKIHQSRISDENRRYSEIIVFSENSDLRGSVTQKSVTEITIIWP